MSEGGRWEDRMGKVSTSETLSTNLETAYYRKSYVVEKWSGILMSLSCIPFWPTRNDNQRFPVCDVVVKTIWVVHQHATCSCTGTLTTVNELLADQPYRAVTRTSYECDYMNHITWTSLINLGPISEQFETNYHPTKHNIRSSKTEYTIIGPTSASYNGYTTREQVVSDGMCTWLKMIDHIIVKSDHEEEGLA